MIAVELLARRMHQWSTATDSWQRLSKAEHGVWLDRATRSQDYMLREMNGEFDKVTADSAS